MKIRFKEHFCETIALTTVVALAFTLMTLRSQDPGTSSEGIDLSGKADHVIASAVKRDSIDSLLTQLKDQDPETLERYFPILRESLPGGHHHADLDEESRTKAIELAMQVEGRRSEVFYRISRVAELSLSKEKKEAAIATLRSIPEDQWPEGFDDFKEDQGDEAAIDEAILAAGKKVYDREGICVTCHQPNGKGLPGAFPPLAGSEWVMGDPARITKIVLKGMMGPVKVGDQEFNSVMTPLESLLTDEEIAAVVTYVRNEWGNQGSAVTTDQVAALREAMKGQSLLQSAALLEEHPLE